MKLINRENGEELVEVGSHKDYASKGVAGAGLGLGIAGTALWLLSGGLDGELEKQVAVLIATRPYQDALIQSDIRRVAEHADFNLFRRTCRMITGELVLPNTPTVTGYPSYNPCRVDNSTSTPAA